MKALVFLAAAVLAACAPLVTRPPTVSLAGLGLESVGLFEQRYVLQLRVRNPNDSDIPVDGLDFEVEVNGMPFASGVSSTRTTLPRQGEALLDVTATSNLASFLRQWRGGESGGRAGLDYRIKGSLRVPGYGAVPFDHRGEVPFPDPGPPAEKTAPGRSAAAPLSGSI